MAVTSACGGVRMVAPLCFATGGSGIARTTDSCGTGAHQARKPSSGAVETSDTTMCVGLKLSARQVSSVMVGSTPINITSLPSSTAWLSAATVTSPGKASHNAAAFSALRGETRMAAGGVLSVARPRTIALDMVPVPTNP
eukprot:scaffold6767_cov223-Isochrysis_galbana.AAC.12